MVRLLVEQAGADIHVVDHEGKTPSMWAEESGWTDIVKQEVGGMDCEGTDDLALEAMLDGIVLKDDGTAAGGGGGRPGLMTFEMRQDDQQKEADDDEGKQDTEDDEEDDEGDYLYDHAPDDMKCPISLKLMTDPVVAFDGSVSN